MKLKVHNLTSHIKYYLLLLLIVHCPSKLALAQWEPDVRLTSTPGSQTSDNNAWCIAARDQWIHVVWRGALSLTDGILYKMSADGGATWNDEILLSEINTYSTSPAIAVSGDHIHVAWSQTLGTNNTEIFYNHSPDNGSSWSGPLRLTSHVLNSQRVTIAASGNMVHLAWEDSRDYPPNGNYTELYYKMSTDGGESWSDDFRLTQVQEEAPGFPSMVVDGSVIHLAFKKSPFNIGEEIYYLRSTDNGQSWSAEERLSFNPDGICRYPTIGFNNENLYVFWSDSRNDEYYEIFYAVSTDGGDTWGSETRLTFDSGDSYGPNIAVAGNALHLTWNENRDGNWEIYYKSSPDQGMSWTPDTRLTNEAANSWYPSIALAGQQVNVVWSDDRTGEWNIYFKRDPNGNPVGVEEETGRQGDREMEVVKVWPNPTRGELKVQRAKGKVEFESLELIDIYGKRLELWNPGTIGTPGTSGTPGTWNQELNISPLPPGIYFIRISLDNQLIVKKIIKI